MAIKTVDKNEGRYPISKESRFFYGPTELLEMPVSELEYKVYQMCGEYDIKKDNNDQ